MGSSYIPLLSLFTCLNLCVVVKKMQAESCSMETIQKSIFLYVMYIIKFTPYRYIAPNNHKIE